MIIFFGLVWNFSMHSSMGILNKTHTIIVGGIKVRINQPTQEGTGRRFDRLSLFFVLGNHGKKIVLRRAERAANHSFFLFRFINLPHAW